jgi:hypothetical protein
MDVYYLDMEDLLSIHKRQFEQFGGAPGIRDAGLIEAARDLRDSKPGLWPYSMRWMVRALRPLSCPNCSWDQPFCWRRSRTFIFVTSIGQVGHYLLPT